MIKIPKPANANRFLDQVAVVTGAAGGIGSAIAERLGRRRSTTKQHGTPAGRATSR